MLTGIQIRNYLFVPEQKLTFGPGMTVLSGRQGRKIHIGGLRVLIFADPAPALEAFDPQQPIYLEASFDLSHNSK